MGNRRMNCECKAVMLIVITISMLAVVMGAAPGRARAQPAASSQARTMGRQHLRHPPFAFLATSEHRSRSPSTHPCQPHKERARKQHWTGSSTAAFEPSGNCTAWKTANSACAQCVFTPDSATVLGPFITRKNAIPKANQRGCLDSLAPGCGTAYESVAACTHAACDSNAECKSATSAQRATCRQAAMQSSCKPLMLQFAEKCGEGGLANKRCVFSTSSDESAMRDYITGLARRACGS